MAAFSLDIPLAILCSAELVSELEASENAADRFREAAQPEDYRLVGRLVGCLV